MSLVLRHCNTKKTIRTGVSNEGEQRMTIMKMVMNFGKEFYILASYSIQKQTRKGCFASAASKTDVSLKNAKFTLLKY